MSSREPMWYCHECHAEMRPLMAPDPICASCHGSFVEQMENPADDPREFQHAHDFGTQPDDFPPGIDGFLTVLQRLMAVPSPTHARNSDRDSTPTSPSGLGERDNPGFTFQFGSNSTPRRTITIGGRPTATRSREVPTMSQYLQRGNEEPENVQDGNITGAMMASYLMALMGGNQMLGPGATGQMGDYVFNQEALDQIVTQLMNESNASHPVPATTEIMERLPREVLEAGSPSLELDCAVCKDQFNLDTEDPEEQVVVALPCKHLFHEGCIMPWLKTSGTCPVCRFALIPQPEQHPITDSSSGQPQQQNQGLLSTLMGMVGNATGTSASSTRRASEDPPDSSRSSGSNRHVPGGWEEDLD